MEHNVGKQGILDILVDIVTTLPVRLGRLMLDLSNSILTLSIVNRVELIVNLRDHLIIKVSAWKVPQIHLCALLHQIFHVLRHLLGHSICEFLNRIVQIVLIPSTLSKALLQELFIIIHFFIQLAQEISTGNGGSFGDTRCPRAYGHH